uniref:Phosphotriesterase-related protein-like n=1 Tax=Saccoglossus kowalevskii TaxID=10224 RepID=A0ABM0M172_SACKO
CGLLDPAELGFTMTHEHFTMVFNVSYTEADRKEDLKTMTDAPLNMPNEKKVLQASAAAQTVTSCPVIIHPGRDQAAPAEIIRILQEAGGDISRTVMSHLDRTLFGNENLLEFAKLGSYCEYDLFGIETSHYQYTDIDMPSDAQRIAYIKTLIDEGYEDKVVIAHDVLTKHRLMKYGGHGYSHILLNVIPKMLKRGISQDAIDKITIHNPRNWLVFNE